MIDNLDKKIIDIMKRDSRCPFVEIANQIGVSEGTVRSRVHRMTEEGIIRGFTIKTSSKNVKALVEIRIDVNTDTQEIARELRCVPGSVRTLLRSAQKRAKAILSNQNTHESEG